MLTNATTPNSAPHYASLATQNSSTWPRSGKQRRAFAHPDHPAFGILCQARPEATVEVSPADIVKRRTAAWNGMRAEIVQVTRRERIGSPLSRAVSSSGDLRSGRAQRGRNVRRRFAALDAPRCAAQAYIRAGWSRISRMARPQSSAAHDLSPYRSGDRPGPHRCCRRVSAFTEIVLRECRFARHSIQAGLRSKPAWRTT